MADTTLQAFSKEIDKQLAEPLRKVLLARELIPIPNKPQGLGKTVIQYHKLTEMSGGAVGYTFTDGNEDTMIATASELRALVHYKDFKIDRMAYEAFKTNNVDLDAAVAISAGFIAAKVEDDTIIDGVKNDGTNYDVNGLYPGAGLDYNTEQVFTSFGNATNAVAGALAMYDNNDVPTNIPFNLVLNPTERNLLRKSRSTNGVKEEPDVIDLLNGGNIYSTTSMAAGKGLMLPTRNVIQPYVDYWIVVDFQTELVEDPMHPKTGGISGRVFSAGRLRIKESKALCKLSDLA